MVEDTLSPVGFERPFIKAAVPTEPRFAMACLSGRHGTAETEMIRHVILVGLEHMGWSEDRMIEEYAAYRLRCLREGKTNEYGRE